MARVREAGPHHGARLHNAVAGAALATAFAEDLAAAVSECLSFTLSDILAFSPCWSPCPRPCRTLAKHAATVYINNRRSFMWSS